MQIYTAVVERCPATRLYVGHVPGLAGAHSQGESLEELVVNLREVIELVLEGDEPMVEGEIVGRPAPIRVLMSSQGDTDV